MKALDKTRILAPSDYFYHFSFSRYGRLKSKFLCERYSHCIHSSCSIELTKTANTWSLTAVSCYKTVTETLALYIEKYMGGVSWAQYIREELTQTFLIQSFAGLLHLSELCELIFFGKVFLLFFPKYMYLDLYDLYGRKRE